MPRYKVNKIFLHLYIDKNILERAKQLIPNLSVFVDNMFREYVILAEHGLIHGIDIRPGRDLNPGRGLDRPA